MANSIDPTKYPKYKYHKDLPETVVNSPEEEDDLGAGWEDSPADHGVITNPSAAQSRQMAIDEANKAKDLTGGGFDSLSKPRNKPGPKPKNTEDE